MEAYEIAKNAVSSIEEKKAENIRVLDIHRLSPLADYFIITNGTNQNQLQAIVDHIVENLEKCGCIPKHIEGKSGSNWILIDYGDVVIHVFDRESRNFYDLDHIWQDAVLVNMD